MGKIILQRMQQIHYLSALRARIRIYGDNPLHALQPVDWECAYGWFTSAVTGALLAHWRRINAAWQKSVESIIETGQLIGEALQEVTQEQLAPLLLFERTTLSRLKRIAEDPRICAHAHILPPSWRTLYELTKLDDESWAQIDIRPDMQRKKATKYLKIHQRREMLNEHSTVHLTLDQLYALCSDNPETRSKVLTGNVEWYTPPQQHLRDLNSLGVLCSSPAVDKLEMTP